MSRRSRLLPVLAVFLATLLLAACSGGTDTGSAASNDAAAVAADSQPAPDASSPDSGTEGPSPTSKRFNLGTNYIRLSPTQPTSSSPTQIEVAEVFWYGCPHCYDFEAYLKKWLKTKPSYVSFVRIPAV
ncbi:MAG TPA: hypothetical protein VFY39_00540, partial [Gammaproteobacteria bacterium]|nr:hypothetical protein [Gammaproteobacteria bacterium]